jgi:hypothetical protein
MGRGLGISTLAVFISLLLWGWMLGSVGVFLSVPLTMALMVALDSSPYTRPLAVLLGPELKDVPTEEWDARPLIPEPAPLTTAEGQAKKEPASGS